jgi:alpha-glucosidase (family GH31 glycosyl hydrolase)
MYPYLLHKAPTSLTLLSRDVFIRNPDSSEHIGQVWPGYTVFPDFFAKNAQQYWTEALQNWSRLGIRFSGIWLDMNEAASFCEGSWCVPWFLCCVAS